MKNWFSWLIAMVLVVFILFGPASRAQDEGGGKIPIAGFYCKDGYCVTSEQGLKRIEQVVNMLVEKLRELQAKTGCT